MSDAKNQGSNQPAGQGPSPDDARRMLEAALASEADSQPSGAEAAQPLPIEVIARDFPQLEILSVIGAGGMGVVYKARQPHLDRFVALKVLHDRFSANPGFIERFTREARAMARLNHPNIVALHDFGQSGGRFYFLMEYVDGMNLRQLQQSRSITPAQALAIVPMMCDALQYAHDEGIIHRDIKPENVLIDSRGRVKIADFGLAKLLGPAEPGHTLTSTGTIMGTPHYMAPEQMEHPQEVDHRADVYALGVVFYEMLTGELPIGRFQPPSAKAQIDVRLDEVVLHAMEREPERRYQHVSEVRTDLDVITSSPAKAATAGPPRAQAGITEQPQRPPDATGTEPPRLCRSALFATVGSIAVVLFILVGLQAVLSQLFRSGYLVSARISWAILMLPVLGGALLGLFAALRIRRAGGRLCGLGYALFPILVPVGILSVAVLVVAWRYVYASIIALDRASLWGALGQPAYPMADENWGVYWGLGILSGLGLTWLIGRRLWIACTPWVQRPVAQATPWKRNRLIRWSVILVVAGLLMVILIATFGQDRFPVIAICTMIVGTALTLFCWWHEDPDRRHLFPWARFVFAASLVVFSMALMFSVIAVLQEESSQRPTLLGQAMRIAQVSKPPRYKFAWDVLDSNNHPLATLGYGKTDWPDQPVGPGAITTQDYATSTARIQVRFEYQGERHNMEIYGFRVTVVGRDSITVESGEKNIEYDGRPQIVYSGSYLGENFRVVVGPTSQTKQTLAQ